MLTWNIGGYLVTGERVVHVVISTWIARLPSTWNQRSESM